MIYICVPAHNDAKTVGLLLWKVRQVFASFPREYQLLVGDDGSDDTTQDVLQSYEHALPLTVIRQDAHRGYAATVEALLRRALALTDRPKRDCAVTVGGDFSISPAVVPDLIRRVESGADVVVAEAVGRRQGMGTQVIRQIAPWLLKPGVQLPGLRDVLSGVCAIRLVTLKRCLSEGGKPLLETDGASARAELIARVAAQARQITAIDIEPSHLRAPAVRENPLALAINLFRAGRALDVPQAEIAIQRVS